MFKEGKLLKFTPFIFKNGAKPKPKYFIVLKYVDGELLLASLPTSKDHIPAYVPVKWGCIELPDCCLNAFIFTAGTKIAVKDGKPFAFPRNTFIYGQNLSTFPIQVFYDQIAAGETVVEEFGDIYPEIFNELITCLKKSQSVRKKYCRIL